MNVDQRLTDDQPQPDEERPRMIRHELVDPFHSIEVCLLKNIIRVHAPLQSTVEPKINHAPQTVAVAREQNSQRILVTVAHSIEQAFDVGIRIRHDWLDNCCLRGTRRAAYRQPCARRSVLKTTLILCQCNAMSIETRSVSEEYSGFKALPSLTLY